MRKLTFIGKMVITCFALAEAAASEYRKHTASDGREYLIEVEPLYNWHQAWHECARRHYQLVAIDSVVKNNRLVQLLKKVIGRKINLWLGGNDEYNLSKNRSFFWSATGKQFNFSYWTENNPNHYGSKEHCVHIWDTDANYKWNDNECNVKMGFICEMNYYFARHKNASQHICEAVKLSNSEISEKLKSTKYQQMDAIHKQLETLLGYRDHLMSAHQKLENDIQNQNMSNILAVQELRADLLYGKIALYARRMQINLEDMINYITRNVTERVAGKLMDVC